MDEFNREAFAEEMKKIEQEFAQESPEIKRFHAAMLVVGNVDNAVMQGLTIAALDVDQGWEWQHLFDNTIRVIPWFVRGFSSARSRGARFSSLWVDTQWDCTYPIEVFAAVFKPIAIEFKKSYSMPASHGYAKEIWEQEYARWKKEIEDRVGGGIPLPNKNGDAFTMRPFQMMKHVGSEKRTIMKGRSVGKSTHIPGTANSNGRTYPPDVVKEAVEKYEEAEPFRAEYMCQPSHLSIETGKKMPVYTQMGKKLFDVRLEGCGRLVTYDVPEVKGHDADMVFVDDMTRTGRIQSKEPNISNPPRSDNGSRAGGEILIRKGEKFLVEGADSNFILVWDGHEGFKKEVDIPAVHGKFVQEESGDGRMTLYRGRPVALIDSDGKEIGRAVIRSDGELDVLEEALDIKLGKGFWALAGVYLKDAVVCYAKVSAFQTEFMEGEEPRIDVWLRTENGIEFACEPKHLFRTQEEAEAGRMKLLEESKED
jgi:hypothetical protein